MNASLKQKELNVLRRFIPLNTLSDDHFDGLIQGLNIEEMPKGSVLFEQGDTKKEFVYLVAGSVTLLAGDMVMETIETGSEASRFALAHQLPRKVKAVVKSKARIIRLATDKLESKQAKKPSATYMVEEAAEDEGDWMTTMLQSPVFQRLPASNLQKVMMKMEEVAFDSREIVVKQGDAADYYYIIKKGTCELIRQSSDKARPIKLAELHSCTSFGEDALLSGAPRNVTVKMKGKGQLLRLTKEDFISLVKEPVLQYLSYQEANEKIQQGAAWLDVREPNVYKEEHIEGSVNIPFFSLRMKVASLKHDQQQILICEQGRTSEAAAFLLLKFGFNAYILQNGMEGVPSQEQAQEDTVDNEPVITEKTEPSQSESIDTELEKAKLTVLELENLYTSLKTKHSEVSAERDALKQKEKSNSDQQSIDALKSELELLKVKFSEQDSVLVIADEKSRSAEAKLKSKEEQLSKLEQEKLDVQVMLESSKDELVGLAGEQAERDGQLQSQRSELEELRKSLLREQESSVSAQLINDELIVKVNALGEELVEQDSFLQNDKKNAEKRLEELEQEKLETQELLENLKDKHAKLVDCQAQVGEELQSQRAEVDALNKILLEERNASVSANEKVDELSLTIKSLQTELEKQESLLENDKVYKEKAALTLEEKEKALKQINDSLLKSQQSLDNLEQSYEQLVNEKSKVEEQLKEQNTVLEKHQVSSAKEKQAAEKQLEDLGVKLDETDKYVLSLEQEAKEAIQRTEEKQQLISQLEDKNTQIEDELEQIQQNVGKSQQEKDKQQEVLTSQLGDLQAELELYKEEKEAFNSEARDRQAKLSELEQCKQAYEEQIKEQQESIAQLVDANENFQKDAEEKNQLGLVELAVKEEYISQLTLKINEFEQELNQQKELTEFGRQSHEKSKKDFATLEQELVRLQEASELSQNEKEREINELNIKLNDRQLEVENNKRSKSEVESSLQSALDQLKTDKLELQKNSDIEIAALKEELHGQNTEFQEEVALNNKQKSDLEVLRDQALALEMSLSKRDADAKDLTAKLEELEQVENNLQSTLAKKETLYQEKDQALNSQLLKLEKSLSEKQTELDDVENQVKTLGVEKELVENNAREMEATLSEGINKQQGLSDELKNAHQQINVLVQNAKDVNDSSQQLEILYKDLKTQLELSQRAEEGLSQANEESGNERIQLVAEIEKLNAENKQLSIALTDTQQYQKDAEASLAMLVNDKQAVGEGLKERITELEKVCDESTQKQAETFEELDVNRKELQQASESYDALLVELEQQKDDKQLVQQQTVKLQDKVVELESKAQLLDDEKSQLEQDLLLEKEGQAELGNKYSQFEKQGVEEKTVLENQVEKMTEALQFSQKETEAVSLKLEETQAVKKTVEDEKYALEQKVVLYEQNKEALTKNIKELEKQVGQPEEVVRLEEENRVLEDETEHLKSTLMDMEIRLESLNVEEVAPLPVDKTNDEVQALKSELGLVREQTESDIQAMQAKLESSEMMNLRLKKTLLALQATTNSEISHNESSIEKKKSWWK